MLVAILVLVISLGAIAAGGNYARTARRVHSFATTRGTVQDRQVASVPGMSSREGRWGRGGGYRPVVTYSYVVDGEAYTSDCWSLAFEGFKRSEVERMIAAVPNQVDVHYDPGHPQDAFLHLPRPRLGYALIAAGLIGVMIGAATLLH